MPYVPALLYLVDLFDAPILTAKINDVAIATTGTCEVNGSFVVRVPGDVPVKDPRDLADLLTQKYAGLLAANAGFPNIAYDDLLDTSHVDLTAPNVEGVFGDRSVIAIQPGKQFYSKVTALSSSPSQAIVTWETFEYLDVDPKAGRFVRTYGGTWSDDVSTCEVSFDSGSSFFPVVDNGVVNVPPLSQGSQFIIRITNTTTKRLHLGSWAVIY